MQLNPVYSYSKLERGTNDQGQRRYLTPDGAKLASVTTILDATKPPEARQALAAWKRRMGYEKAQAITAEAAARGTIMHSYLEKTLLGQNPQSGTNVYHKQGWDMAQTLIANYLKPHLNEVWGLEANLYYPELYAGTTDCCGVWEGEPSIVDFKQSNRPKSNERVFDYKLQLAAYAHCHNQLFGTNIHQGVIVMCTPQLEHQCWVLKDQEFDDFSQLWWQRVAEFYNV